MKTGYSPFSRLLRAGFMKNLFRNICLVVMLLLLLPTFAFAYIDPGAGSLILQGLAAAVVAVTAFWGRIRTLLGKLFAKKDQQK